MANAKVTMYSKDNCPQCDTAKQVLGMDPFVDLEVKKLDVDFTREELLARFPTARTYPQFDLEGAPVGNFKQLGDKLLSN